MGWNVSYLERYAQYDLKILTKIIEYGGLFKGKIIKERQFINNNESEKIIFWNGKDNIGYIDEIDQKLLEYY